MQEFFNTAMITAKAVARFVAFSLTSLFYFVSVYG